MSQNLGDETAVAVSCRLSGQRPSSKPAQGKRGSASSGEPNRAPPWVYSVSSFSQPNGTKQILPLRVEDWAATRGLIGILFVYPGGRSFGSTELVEVARPELFEGLASPGLACRRAFGPLSMSNVATTLRRI